MAAIYYKYNFKCYNCGKTVVDVNLCLTKLRSYIFMGCKTCNIVDDFHLPFSVGGTSSSYKPPLEVKITKT